jgi:hypothetical protein
VDLNECTCNGTVVGNELSHNGEWLGCVYGHAGTEKGRVSHTVGAEVATVLVARCVISARRRIVAAGSTSTLIQALVGTNMRRIGRGLAVGLPDVHLKATRTRIACASIHIVRGWSPVIDISLFMGLKCNSIFIRNRRKEYHAINELYVL